MKKGIFISLLWATALGAPLQAAILEYSIVVDNGGANFIAGSLGDFVLPQFNSAVYGTLNSIVISVTANSIGGWNRIDNGSATRSGNADVNIGSELTVTGPGALLVFTDPNESISGFVGVNSDGGVPNFIGSDALGVIGSSSTATQTGSPIDFTSYIGSGNLTYSFFSDALQGIQLYGSLRFQDFSFDSDTPEFNFTAKVTYTYEPLADPPGGNVPEPGTFSMVIALAGLSLAVWGKRRKTPRRSHEAKSSPVE
jgi:hypothetical protein